MASSSASPSAASGTFARRFNHSSTGVIGAVLVLIGCVVASIFPSARNIAYPELFWAPILLLGVTVMRWWQDEVNETRPKRDQVPATAVVMALVFWFLLIFGLYGMTRALWQVGAGGVAAVFVGVIWAMAAAAVGGLVGFLFGVTRVHMGAAGGGNEVRRDGKVTTEPAQPVTILEHIAQWLATAIAGGALFQAGNLGHVLNGLGDKFATLHGAGPADPANGWLSTLGAASSVLFCVLGFLSIYLLTKLFLDPALRQAARPHGPELRRRAELTSLELDALNNAPITVGDGVEKFGQLAQEAAKKIVGEDIEQLHDWRDLGLYAKAQLSLNNPKAGIEAYRKAIDIVPDDAELRLGFSVALAMCETGTSDRGDVPTITTSARGLILDQLEHARRSLKRVSPAELRKNIYKSLMYSYLYLKQPDGFKKALAMAREYFDEPDAVRSVGVLINVACAYGQAVKWLKGDPAGKLNSQDLTVDAGPGGELLNDRQRLVEWISEQAIRLVREAVERHGGCKTQLRRIARLDPPQHEGDEDNDLESLRDDPRLHAVLGPPAAVAPVSDGQPAPAPMPAQPVPPNPPTPPPQAPSSEAL